MNLSRAGIIAALLCAVTLVPSAAGRFNTVIVSGDTAAFENEPGAWWFNRDFTTATPYEFALGDASIGNGSLYVLPIQNTFPLTGKAGNDKFIGEFFMLTPMGQVESVSYDFKVGANRTLPTDYKQFYMSVYANFGASDPAKFYDCRYSVTPASGSNAGFTTVTFDPQLTYPRVQRTGAAASPFPCPASPAAMGADATLRMFALNVGDTSTHDTDLDGYFDNIVVTTSTGETVYDFDAVPQTANDCKNGGWQLYGFRNQGQCIQFVNTGK